MNKIAINWVVFVLLQAVIGQTAWAAAPVSSPAVAFKKDRVYIETKARRYTFHVEIATRPKQQELGLMNRKSLAANKGMLFLWDHDEAVAMWMKGTLIPLDMLFIDKRGTILYMAEDAKPNSLETITAGVPVRAVLELAGGTVKSKRIALGDKVIFSHIRP